MMSLGFGEYNKMSKPRLTIITSIAITAVVLIFLRYGFTWMMPTAVGVAGILLAISVHDFNTREIPDRLVIALIPLAGLAFFIQPHISLMSRGIGFLTVSLPMLVLALVINGAFGGGDIKLMAVCGFLLGWQNTLVAFFIALMLAGCWIIYLAIKGRAKKGQHIAFGPALCTGVFTALLVGSEIVDWYIGFLFLH